MYSLAEGLVGGEGFAVDASLIKADANRKRGFSGKEGIKWERPGRKTRAVREYLDALDNDEQVVRAHEATRKAISLTDPASCWTSAPGGPANYSYSTNYLIDIDSAIIVGVEASPSTLSEEAQAARTMIDHTEKRFGVKPEHLAGDTAYGNAQMLGWLVEEKQITPHVPVIWINPRARRVSSVALSLPGSLKRTVICVQTASRSGAIDASSKTSVPVSRKPTPSSIVRANPTVATAC